MANYTTGADLVQDILFRSGEPTNGSSQYQAAVVKYLNRAYQIIWMGGSEFDPAINENWWWLLKEGNLILQRSISRTAAVVLGSTSITLNLAVPVGRVGNFIKVADVVYRISAIADSGGGLGTVVTLDGAYVQADAAAAPVVMFQLDITLAVDVLRLASPMNVSVANGAGGNYDFIGRDYQVLGVSNRRLSEMAPLPLVQFGSPRFFAHIAENKVRFDRGPQEGLERIRVDYIYMQRPAPLADDATEPLVPAQYRHLLSDIGAFLLLIDKNDDRAVGLGAIAKSGLQSMAAENRVRLQTYGGRVREFAPAPVITTVSDEDFPRAPASMGQTQ